MITFLFEQLRMQIIHVKQILCYGICDGVDEIARIYSHMQMWLNIL